MTKDKHVKKCRIKTIHHFEWKPEKGNPKPWKCKACGKRVFD